MTDLATRIADVKQKAEALQKCHVSEAEAYRMAFRFSVAEPDLILAMAARIEELEKALEPFGTAGMPWVACDPTDDSPWVQAPDNTKLRIGSVDVGLTIGDFRTAARAYRGEKG